MNRKIKLITICEKTEWIKLPNTDKEALVPIRTSKEEQVEVVNCYRFKLPENKSLKSKPIVFKQEILLKDVSSFHCLTIHDLLKRELEKSEEYIKHLENKIKQFELSIQECNRQIKFVKAMDKKLETNQYELVEETLPNIVHERKY